MTINLGILLMSLERGGAEEVSIDLINGLDTASFSPHLILRPALYEKIKYDIAPHVSTLILNVPDIHPLPLYNKISVIWQINQLLRKYNINILHSQQFSAQKYGLPAAWLVGCKSIYTEHLFKKGERIWLKRLFQRYSNRVVCVSNALKVELIRWGCYPNLFEVIENGVSDPLPSLTPLPEEVQRLIPLSKIILTVGRLSFQKSFNVLIDGFYIFNADHHGYSLIIVGEGEERKRLEEQIIKLGLNGKVILMGYLTRETLMSLVRKADIFIMPSRQEGLPLAMIEAMLLERTVCVSPIDAFNGLVEDGVNGLVMREISAHGISEILERVINADDEAKSVRKIAREIALGRFSLECMVRKYENLYFSLTGFHNLGIE